MCCYVFLFINIFVYFLLCSLSQFVGYDVPHCGTYWFPCSTFVYASNIINYNGTISLLDSKNGSYDVQQKDFTSGVFVVEGIAGADGLLPVLRATPIGTNACYRVYGMSLTLRSVRLLSGSYLSGSTGSNCCCFFLLP
jgi:hypothetical protein